MKKNCLYGIAIGILAAVLTGCGDGSEFLEMGDVNSVQQTVLAAGQNLSDAEIAILYEATYPSGELSAEDYRELAAQSAEKGQIRRQRDLLEQSYRLYEEEQDLKTLQTIAVNLTEEDGAIWTEAQTMLQNLEIAEYQGESIHMIASREWFDTMMPKLSKGVRNYFLLEAGNRVLSMQVGYDEAGEPFSDVWYAFDGRVMLLNWSGNTVHFLETGLEEGGYSGEFTLWTLDGGTGDIRQEQGALSDGTYNGGYQVRLHTGEAAGELYDLWSNRDNMEYSTYTGAFNDNGDTTLKQPSASEIAAMVKDTAYDTCVMYALDEAGTGCLFAGLEEGEEYFFHLANMGIDPYPDWTVYEAAEQGAEGNSGMLPQVRIYDGEIQYLMGNTWVSLGTLAQYRSQDPFREYGERKAQYDEDMWGRTDAGESEDTDDRFGVGKVTADKTSGQDANTTPSTNTQKPSTTTPSTNTQKPSTTTPSTNTQKPSATTPSSDTQKPSTTTPSTDSQGSSGSGSGSGTNGNNGQSNNNQSNNNQSSNSDNGNSGGQNNNTGGDNGSVNGHGGADNNTGGESSGGSGNNTGNGESNSDGGNGSGSGESSSDGGNNIGGESNGDGGNNTGGESNGDGGKSSGGDNSGNDNNAGGSSSSGGSGDVDIEWTDDIL